MISVKTRFMRRLQAFWKNNPIFTSHLAQGMLLKCWGVNTLQEHGRTYLTKLILQLHLLGFNSWFIYFLKKRSVKLTILRGTNSTGKRKVTQERQKHFHPRAACVKSGHICVWPESPEQNGITAKGSEQGKCYCSSQQQLVVERIKTEMISPNRLSFGISQGTSGICICSFSSPGSKDNYFFKKSLLSNREGLCGTITVSL